MWGRKNIWSCIFGSSPLSRYIVWTRKSRYYVEEIVYFAIENVFSEWITCWKAQIRIEEWCKSYWKLILQSFSAWLRKGFQRDVHDDVLKIICKRILRYPTGCKLQQISLWIFLWVSLNNNQWWKNIVFKWCVLVRHKLNSLSQNLLNNMKNRNGRLKVE